MVKEQGSHPALKGISGWEGTVGYQEYQKSLDAMSVEELWQLLGTLVRDLQSRQTDRSKASALFPICHIRRPNRRY